MKYSSRSVQARITQVVTAWETLRPEKSFAGLSIEQFKAALQPSIATRADVETLQDKLVAAQSLRIDADKASLDLIQRVAHAVQGDPDEGSDSAFYEALGYVRKSERKSGLTRGKKPADTAPIAA